MESKLKKLIKLFVGLLICNSVFAQVSREELSKELKKPNANIEKIVTALTDRFNKDKGTYSAPEVLFVGATDSKRNINLNIQITKELNKAQIDNLKAGAKQLTTSQTCDVPIVYVLLKEHGLTVSFWWFDKNMKQILVSVVDANSCK
jgi:hypothetical protein